MACSLVHCFNNEWKVRRFFSLYLLFFIFYKFSIVSTNKLQSFYVIFHANEGSLYIHGDFPRKCFYFFYRYSVMYLGCMRLEAFDCFLNALKFLSDSILHVFFSFSNKGEKKRSGKQSENGLCCIMPILCL